MFRVFLGLLAWMRKCMMMAFLVMGESGGFDWEEFWEMGSRHVAIAHLIGFDW